MAFRTVNRENDIRSLFSLHYGDSMTSRQSRAFQLALWELIYEDDTDLSVSNGAGYFYVQSGFGSGTVAIANQFLASLGDWDGSSNAWNFHVLQADGSQNLLSVTAVPTPAALALVLAGLGGLLLEAGAARGQPRLSTRAFSRSQSRAFTVARLSCCFLPLASPTSSFARPRFQ